MQKPQRLILVLAVVIFALAIGITLLSSHPDDIQSHLARLNRIKSTRQVRPFRLDHYLHADTWLWYWRGRPRTERWRMEALDDEWDALIRLGYFEVREFPLQHRTFDKRFLMEVMTEVHNAPTGFLSDRNFRAFGVGSYPSNGVRLAVCKEDVAAFRRIVGDIDGRK
jgi:hypothetical protein